MFRAATVTLLGGLGLMAWVLGLRGPVEPRAPGAPPALEDPTTDPVVLHGQSGKAPPDSDAATASADAEPAASMRRRLLVLVLDAEGQPVADATVTVAPVRTGIEAILGALPREDPYGDHAARATTDGSGQTWINVPVAEAVVSLMVSAASRDGTQATLRPVPVAATAEQVRVTVAPAAVVRGRVLGLGTGDASRALVDAYCTAWSETPGHRYLPVDDSGAFQVAGVVDRVTLVARCAGRLPSAPYVTEVQAGRDVYAELQLGPEGLDGRVVLASASGQFLPRGSLVLVRSGHAGAWTRIRVGDDGLLDCRGLCLAGQALDAFVWPTRTERGSTWLSAEWRGLVAPLAWASGGRVAIPAAATAVLRCRTSGGDIVGNFDVRIVPDRDSTTTQAGLRVGSIAVGPDGRADLGALPYPVPSGRYEVQDSTGRFLWAGQLPERPDEVEIDVGERVPASIRLLDAQGHPVRSWSVRAVLHWPDGSSTVCTFAEREVWTALVAPADLALARIEVEWHGAGPPQQVRAVADAAQLDLMPPPGTGTVLVTFRDAWGEPVERDWFVDLQPATGPRLASRAGMKWRARAQVGSSHIVGVPPGRYTWVARRGTEERRGVAPVDVAGDGVTALEIRVDEES